MKLVYCIKDYEFFEKGQTYYMKEVQYISNMIYTRGYAIFSLDDTNNQIPVKISEIGYLYPEVFEDLETHRERLLNDLLGKSK